MLQQQNAETKKEGTPALTPSFGQLKLKKKRKMQAWQAYHAMTYQSKWKTVIDEEYETYLKDQQDSNSENGPAMTRFAYMNAFMRNKFEEETEEMKAEVEKYRLEADEPPANNLNITFQT